ncbi:hypothetical protein CEUSTIGMA_g6585.t1 [Chlamydomonas eustigma]|uniref:Protein kinase domain-containing protein n=1 Tax=Chlamydomonas eustigma TaxID=1157962 RepID=A0A250X7V1_9CHLO|nr:hypothetical protein CEUSTIGMA_g6585.t1 [Chlamydomonas eustigma]|eukprot:GAX79145.1 hypothetical protein CEUSTIGMA_g6585.t1 [Chlamydomonas eustigma]
MFRRSKSQIPLPDKPDVSGPAFIASKTGHTGQQASTGAGLIPSPSLPSLNSRPKIPSFASDRIESVRDSACKTYPTGASSYELLEECGSGMSATVFRSLCKPLNVIVAIKRCSLASLEAQLDELMQETQLMASYSHSNILPLHCSFVDGNFLYIVMPYMTVSTGGSIAHIMKYKHAHGLEEPVISTIMLSVLKALQYIHRQGGIHRDVKAGNILVSGDGQVMLGDMGVSATMQRVSSWGNETMARMSLVGSPCWMAPEVLEQDAGYDESADLWSFGITLLELAHGHAPFASYPPLKVLMMTLQNPPTADLLDNPQEANRRGLGPFNAPSIYDTKNRPRPRAYSRHMKEVIALCLQRDPNLRPSAKALLNHKFFKQARDNAYLKKHLLQGLPILPQRVQNIRRGKDDAATCTPENQKRLMMSYESYLGSVTDWNFNLPVEAVQQQQVKLAMLEGCTSEDSLHHNPNLGVKPPSMPSFQDVDLGDRQCPQSISPSSSEDLSNNSPYYGSPPSQLVEVAMEAALEEAVRISSSSNVQPHLLQEGVIPHSEPTCEGIDSEPTCEVIELQLGRFHVLEPSPSKSAALKIPTSPATVAAAAAISAKYLASQGLVSGKRILSSQVASGSQTVCFADQSLGDPCVSGESVQDWLDSNSTTDGAVLVRRVGQHARGHLHAAASMQALPLCGQHACPGEEHRRAATKMGRSKSTDPVSFPLLVPSENIENTGFVLKFPEKGIVDSAASEVDWAKATGCTSGSSEVTLRSFLSDGAPPLGMEVASGIRLDSKPGESVLVTESRSSQRDTAASVQRRGRFTIRPEGV